MDSSSPAQRRAIKTPEELAEWVWSERFTCVQYPAPDEPCPDPVWMKECIRRAIIAAVQAERERCAAIADRMAQESCGDEGPGMALSIAAAIRAEPTAQPPQS